MAYSPEKSPSEEMEAAVDAVPLRRHVRVPQSPPFSSPNSPSPSPVQRIFHRFESLRQRNSVKGGKQLEKQATLYYEKLKRDRSMKKVIEAHRSSTLYNPELMARVSEICNADRERGIVTNYVDVKTAIVEEFGEATFAMNKHFVTEFLVQNSNKIQIENLDAEETIQQPHNAPLGFVRRIKEICEEMRASGKDFAYPKVKTLMTADFGHEAVEEFKDLITLTLKGKWAPAPPPKSRSDVSVEASAAPAFDFAAATPENNDGGDEITSSIGATASEDDGLYATPAVTEPVVQESKNTAENVRFRDRNKSVHVKVNRASMLYCEASEETGSWEAVDAAPGAGPKASTTETYMRQQKDGLYADMDANYALPEDMLNMFEADGENDAEIRRILALMKKKEGPLDLSGKLNVEIQEYDSEGGRNRFLLQIKYQDTSWLLHKYYTEFQELSTKMSTNKKLHEYAKGLPEKHSVGMVLQKGFARISSINKAGVARKEAEFMIGRMKGLEDWLRSFCNKFSVDELQDESCVDEFFEIFFRVVQ